MQFLSIARDEALAQHKAAIAGDVDAATWFRELFDDAAECWLCGSKSIERTVDLIADPFDPQKVLLAPLCAACRAQPVAKLVSRQLKMLRQMWPLARWKMPNDKNLRGRLPKQRSQRMKR